MAIKMQIRRGTLAAWTAAGNPTLIAGELGFVTDTGKTAFKIGDGTLAWDVLPYVNSTYPEFTPSSDLDAALTQGRYPLSNSVSYTNDPTEFVGSTTDGDSILMVTVPTSGIVIQELTTSLTSKRWIRAKNASTWSTWQRLHGTIATDSLTVVDLTATGTVTIPAGAVATPSLRFASAANTGIYSTGANNLTVTTGGADRVSIGTTTTTVSTDLTVTGVVAANAVGTGTVLSVNTGATTLRATNINGDVSITSATPANQLLVGPSTVTSALTKTVIKQNAYPAVGIFGRNPADAGGALFTTYDNSGTARTTIRSDGVPTTGTDLTHKAYVDLAVVTNSSPTYDNTTFLNTAIIAGTTVITSNISTLLPTVGQTKIYRYQYGHTGGSAGRAVQLKFTTDAGVRCSIRSFTITKGTVNDIANGLGATLSNSGALIAGYVIEPSVTAFQLCMLTTDATTVDACMGYFVLQRIS